MVSHPRKMSSILKKKRLVFPLTVAPGSSWIRCDQASCGQRECVWSSGESLARWLFSPRECASLGETYMVACLQLMPSKQVFLLEKQENQPVLQVTFRTNSYWLETSETLQQLKHMELECGVLSDTVSDSSHDLECLYNISVWPFAQKC